MQIADTGTQKHLRFDTTIVTVGAGAFKVTGRRSGANTADMTTTQRIYDSVGDHRAAPPSPPSSTRATGTASGT